jgi:uncharacterized protein
MTLTLVLKGAQPRQTGLAGRTALAALAVAGLALATTGCSNPVLPAPLLYQLRSAPPAAAVAALPSAAMGQPAPSQRAQPTIQLLPVSLPEVLDRDAIVVARGGAGVQALVGHRWAEPLRDAVPRLLRQDLAPLLGVDQVWAAPLPAGLHVQRQLRVELLALQANEARTQVGLQARWTLSDPRQAVAPVTALESFEEPIQGADVDAVVVAHRAALWRLSRLIAQGLAPGLRALAP